MKNKLSSKYLKQKKLKGKKLIIGVFGAALLCAIDGATIESTLFKDGDYANTLHVLTQLKYFYILKKLLLIHCGARANILAIILLHNGYFLKYFFKKY
jgi:hypothetical protein